MLIETKITVLSNPDEWVPFEDPNKHFFVSSQTCSTEQSKDDDHGGEVESPTTGNIDLLQSDSLDEHFKTWQAEFTEGPEATQQSSLSEVPVKSWITEEEKAARMSEIRDDAILLSQKNIKGYHSLELLNEKWWHSLNKEEEAARALGHNQQSWDHSSGSQLTSAKTTTAIREVLLAEKTGSTRRSATDFNPSVIGATATKTGTQLPQELSIHEPFQERANLFEGYDWDELPPIAKEAVLTLGYSKDTWEKDLDPPLCNKWWIGLNKKQQKAARYLGYTQETWDKEEGRFCDELLLCEVGNVVNNLLACTSEEDAAFYKKCSPPAIARQLNPRKKPPTPPTPTTTAIHSLTDEVKERKPDIFDIMVAKQFMKNRNEEKKKKSGKNCDAASEQTPTKSIEATYSKSLLTEPEAPVHPKFFWL